MKNRTTLGMPDSSNWDRDFLEIHESRVFGRGVNSKTELSTRVATRKHPPHRLEGFLGPKVITKTYTALIGSRH